MELMAWYQYDSQKGFSDLMRLRLLSLDYEVIFGGFIGL